MDMGGKPRSLDSRPDDLGLPSLVVVARLHNNIRRVLSGARFVSWQAWVETEKVPIPVLVQQCGWANKDLLPWCEALDLGVASRGRGEVQG